MENPEKIKKIIEDSDYILIGAGNGLSGIAGPQIESVDTFKKLFPGYTRRYGLKTVSEALSYYFPTIEEHYAFIARYISAFRYTNPFENVYSSFFELVKNKPYFVVTTATDGQFVNAGFEKQNIYSPNGDLSFFQCSLPCSKKNIHNKKIVDNLLNDLAISPFAISSSNIPTCPRCGSFLEPNTNSSTNFNHKFWKQNSSRYIDFLRNAVKGKLALLELGVGIEAHTLIKFPFEYIAANYKNAILIRINSDDILTKVPFAEKRTIAFSMDIRMFFSIAS